MSTRVYFSFLFFLIFIAGNAQNSRVYDLGDKWFEDYGSRGLKVGDKMPDVSLGKVTNNYTGKSRFSDFKGKLVILDFWSTSCKSCIANFPHIDQLQREFADKIQIILVNPGESQEMIDKAFSKNQVSLPNVPSIVVDDAGGIPVSELYKKSEIFRLFPMRGVPHHVWIDPNGTVILRGSAYNTNSEKIGRFLSGNTIQSISDFSVVPQLNTGGKSSPYYPLMAAFEPGLSIPMLSYFTPYNNNLSGIHGEQMWNVRDSTNKTVRTTLTNTPLLDMYLRAISRKKFMTNGLKREILYGSDSYGDLVVFSPNVDPLDFTSEYTRKMYTYVEDTKDGEYIQSRYCYEQILPWDSKEDIINEFMLQNLNRFVEQKFGVIAETVKKQRRCYVVVRTSNKSTIDGKSADDDVSITSFVKQGRKYTKYSNIELAGIFHQVIRSNPIFQQAMYQNKKAGKPSMIVNETGWNWDKPLNMALPAEGLDNITALKAALKQYDLDILEAEREFSFLVFRKSMK